MNDTILREEEIQETAINYLSEYYKNCSCNRIIYAAQEVYTKVGKRADGILVWCASATAVRLVSLEAKSAKTIGNLIIRLDQQKVACHSLWAARIVTLILFSIPFVFFNFYIRLEPLWIVVLMLSIGVLTSFFSKYLVDFLPFLFKTADVIEQSMKYPGNERWVAVGYDNWKKTEQKAQLVQLCQQKGLGLLEVHPSGIAPKILVRPVFRKCFRKVDFLKYYKKENSIRKAIFETPPQFKGSWSGAEFHHQLKTASWGILPVLLLFLLFLPGFHTPPNRSKVAPTMEEEFGLLSQPKAETEFIEKATAAEPLTCDFPFQGTKYLLKDKCYPSAAAASDRVEILRKAGLTGCGFFNLACYETPSDESGWCVFAYRERNSLQPIQKHLERYRYILKKAGLSFEEAEIWRVTSYE